MPRFAALLFFFVGCVPVEFPVDCPQRADGLAAVAPELQLEYPGLEGTARCLDDSESICRRIEEDDVVCDEALVVTAGARASLILQNLAPVDMTLFSNSFTTDLCNLSTTLPQSTEIQSGLSLLVDVDASAQPGRCLSGLAIVSDAQNFRSDTVIIPVRVVDP